MANDYKTPGVYIEEIPKFPPSVAQVETAIPAFIGYTQKASRDGEDLTLKPTRITSLLEYTEYFGEALNETGIVVKAALTKEGAKVVKELWTASFEDESQASKHIMYYAMQLYFANGGGPCYIVSVSPFSSDNTIVNGDPTAKFDTTKTKGLLSGLTALEEEDEPTLIVFPESQGLPTSGDFTQLMDAALSQCDKLKDRFVIMDVPAQERDLRKAVADTAIEELRNVGASLKYGAAYFPNVQSVFNYYYDKSDSSTLKISMVENGGTPTDKLFKDLNNADKSKAKLAIDSLSINLPPSAAVAGVYARVDGSRGVWKAPANENIFSIDGLSIKITDEMQDSLNVDANSGKSINCIRYFTGKGYKIWGARTLAGNDNEWRYVPVRRFFNMVEESVKKATYPFVFEPNDANTWVRVRAMIENFLILQWRAGALQGDKPDKAFYVAVGLGITMTPLDILEGRMIVEIGMAVVRPAEFIILRFSHKMAEA
jgi:hypothetical protein